ncbi:membrane protein [Pontibacillus halophilus JSM 076056 = DSM 19796]|uniref:Membrane protein n=1 Tax=Pontibacillus halophilus JSM 076056 = DSM 19796 TaxID=1385510 RepID=A0A0A5GGU6_9BACI|nr:YeeE/YedE family protein [Pontibacillus halophilus]KGX92456.1 membrane protein [Pontibacillus halophilus JSM 076056 = DSM 19796]
MQSTIAQQTTRQKRTSTTVLANLDPVQKPYVWLGIVASILVFIATVAVAGWTQGLLFILGIAFGLTLLHARFGFTSAFRRFTSVGNAQGLQAHMIMLAVATTLFALILATGFTFTGIAPSGYVFPVSVAVVVGSFLFGIGMQLGNGCASGTLYTVGGGKSPMLITLIAFIAGSVLGAYHIGFWREQASLPTISFADQFGYVGGWALSIGLFALIYSITYIVAKVKNPPSMKPLPTVAGFKKLVRGSWPLFVAAIILAILNAITLAMRGTPWGITSAFALWGSKVLMFFGVDVSSWGYWQGSEALNQSVLMDTTSVMNFGIILGAFIAAAASGTFKPGKIKPGVAMAATIGGLLMGYGARLAYGCNIGAYFGGIASMSLHGWVWMAMALIGTGVALFIRPLFGLRNPNPNDSMC